jgi:hypothetical protein
MVPSAEEEMQFQALLATLTGVQVAPELAEVYIGPRLDAPFCTPATNFVPSAEQARLRHF